MTDSKLPEDLFIPDGTGKTEAHLRCTHLGIGAHPDDLEFMAFHGISSCYDKSDHWFGGITCTNGGNCSRSGAYANYSDQAMIAVRAEEQKEAARLGHYSFVHQLGLSSSEVNVAASINPLTDRLTDLLKEIRPTTLYTHNPADSHPTHVAVCLAVLEAVRRQPPENRPSRTLGCEVWRSLDWLSPEDKVILDVSRIPDLAGRLHASFDSQIAGGKNYGDAVVGRSRSNATFLEKGKRDTLKQAWFAMNLTPLTRDGSPGVQAFTKALVQRLDKSISDSLPTDTIKPN